MKSLDNQLCFWSILFGFKNLDPVLRRYILGLKFRNLFLKFQVLRLKLNNEFLNLGILRLEFCKWVRFHSLVLYYLLFHGIILFRDDDSDTQRRNQPPEGSAG